MAKKSTFKKALLLPVFSLLAGGLMAGILNMSRTLSYMTDKGDLTNTNTIGENVIEIVETFVPPELQPGENTYTKDVSIKNTGDVPCYIRTFINFSDNDVRGESKISPDGTNFYTYDEFLNHLPSGWRYVGSGQLAPYFYYTEQVAPGESTPSLIKTIQTTFEKAEDVEEYDVYVYAESVQVLDKNGDEFTGANKWERAWLEYLN